MNDMNIIAGGCWKAKPIAGASSGAVHGVAKRTAKMPEKKEPVIPPLLEA
jgi:hypothetical protein